jgi:hypothetical protein
VERAYPQFGDGEAASIAVVGKYYMKGVIEEKHLDICILTIEDILAKNFVLDRVIVLDRTINACHELVCVGGRADTCGS